MLLKVLKRRGFLDFKEGALAELEDAETRAERLRETEIAKNAKELIEKYS